MDPGLFKLEFKGKKKLACVRPRGAEGRSRK